MRHAHGLRPADADRLLWRLADATAGLAGHSLYRTIVSVLATTLDTTFVALTFRPPETRSTEGGAPVAIHARPDGSPSVEPVPTILGVPGTIVHDGAVHPCLSHLCTLHPRPGDPPAADLRVVPILDEDGTPLGEIAVFFATPAPSPQVIEVVAIFARRAAGDMRHARTEAELSRLAMTDPLTGIANRRAFTGAADREVRRARRFRDSLSAMIVDIDHFKQINDRAGHAVGDQVLHRFAEGMTRTLRSIDVLGRIGGEEFALLLPGTPLPGAVQTADRIRAMARTIPLPPATGLDALTISVGVAELHPADASAEAMLGRADAAMYRAKRNGRDRTVVADAPDACPPIGVS